MVIRFAGTDADVNGVTSRKLAEFPIKGSFLARPTVKIRRHLPVVYEDTQMNGATRRAIIPRDEAVSDGIPASLGDRERDHHGVFVVVTDILGWPLTGMAAPVENQLGTKQSPSMSAQHANGAR